jgi:cell division protease FtsH
MLAALLAYWLWQVPGEGGKSSIPYSQFRQELAAGNVQRVKAKGETLTGRFKEPVKVEPLKAEKQDGEKSKEAKAETIERFTTTLPPFGDDKLTAELIAKGVVVDSEGSGSSVLWLILINALPLLLLVALFVFLFRGARQQASQIMSVGRAGAKRFVKERTGVSFDDVAGAEEAKRELREVIAFLTEPGRFSALGARVPKGMLLVGPPGTGKTLLARAVAGEAGVPFFSITGSDFMEMFVGVGASRVRDLFNRARRSTPCIIFLDELDSIGRHRGAGLGGGHDEREQTLNQLLSAMDGFEPNEGIVVMAATNRPDILDPALLRPGRFDRRVTVDLPSLSERTAILRVHTRKVPLGDSVNLEDISRSMPGRSGADLANLVNEAALLAARAGKERVGMAEFLAARDRILMGQLRGGIVLKGMEKHAVAVHEAGHAVVAWLVPEADPVEKVSILPRGRALGATQQLPEERYNFTEAYLRARLAVMLGGRAAERIFLDTQTTGAADDLAQATRLARHMVGQWGMSEKLKHVAFQETDTEVFLGQQLSHRREYSEQTAHQIDLEVQRLIDACYGQAERLLKENRPRVEALAAALEDRETIEGEQIAIIMDNHAPSGDHRPAENKPPKAAPAAAGSTQGPNC